MEAIMAARIKRLGQLSELKRSLVDKRHGAHNKSLKFSQRLVNRALRRQNRAIVSEQLS